MMPSFWQILLVLALVVLLFGRGKIKGLMEDVAQGIKGFKRGMKEDETVAQTSSKTIEAEATVTAEDATPHKDAAAQKDGAAHS